MSKISEIHERNGNRLVLRNTAHFFSTFSKIRIKNAKHKMKNYKAIAVNKHMSVKRNKTLN